MPSSQVLLDEVFTEEQGVGPCQFHGCVRPGDTPVVTNWKCYAGWDDTVTMVTLQGWIEERCADCAVRIVLWPPKPKQAWVR